MPEDKRYYLPSEIVIHNKPDDIWVSFLGNVYDVTNLVNEHKKTKIVKTILAYAGKDISHWFDKKTKDIKKVVHPVSGSKVPYTPHGALSQGNPPIPSAKWTPLDTQVPSTDSKLWWLDKCRFIGYLTKKARPVRIINVLAPASHRNDLIWVASEETLNQIIKRILPHNSHANSYTLKFEGRILHNAKTLDQNNILDERDKFVQLGLTDDNYIPAIKLYYNDDLTKD